MSPTDIGEMTWRPGYTGDPHPFFAEPQILAPVSRGVVDGVPVWLVSRYQDVRRLLADPAISSDPQHAGPAAAAIPWVGAGQSKSHPAAQARGQGVHRGAGGRAAATGAADHR